MAKVLVNHLRVRTHIMMQDKLLILYLEQLKMKEELG